MRRLRYSALKKKAMPCFAARTNAKACLGTIKQRDSGIFYDLAVFFIAWKTFIWQKNRLIVENVLTSEFAQPIIEKTD